MVSSSIQPLCKYVTECVLAAGITIALSLLAWSPIYQSDSVLPLLLCTGPPPPPHCVYVKYRCTLCAIWAVMYIGVCVCVCVSLYVYKTKNITSYLISCELYHITSSSLPPVNFNQELDN